MTSKKKIAFQGEPGAYSHLACNEACPDLEPVACESFEDAFAAVSEGTAALAMIPIENSLGGRVADMHHLLPQASLYIINEHFQAVQHCLLAPPGATLEGLAKIQSHTQALAQCRGLIRELGVEAVHGRLGEDRSTRLQREIHSPGRYVDGILNDDVVVRPQENVFP